MWSVVEIQKNTGAVFCGKQVEVLIIISYL